MNRFIYKYLDTNRQDRRNLIIRGSGAGQQGACLQPTPTACFPCSRPLLLCPYPRTRTLHIFISTPHPSFPSAALVVDAPLPWPS